MASLRTAVFLLILRAVASAPPDANSSRGLSDADAAPGHAGCFVMQGNAMLAVKLTYDGNLFDIPGGQTNWHEPARKTAERETWEESGYPVDVQELLTTVRGGSFNIFRCTLKQQEPGKGPDHEVSSVRWMNPGEVDDYMGQHLWRFQDDQAYLYSQWLHNAEQNQDGQHRRLIMV